MPWDVGGVGILKRLSRRSENVKTAWLLLAALFLVKRARVYTTRFIGLFASPIQRKYTITQDPLPASWYRDYRMGFSVTHTSYRNSISSSLSTKQCFIESEASSIEGHIHKIDSPMETPGTGAISCIYCPNRVMPRYSTPTFVEAPAIVA